MNRGLIIHKNIKESDMEYNIILSWDEFPFTPYESLKVLKSYHCYVIELTHFH